MQPEYQRQKHYWNALARLDPDAAVIDPNDTLGMKNGYLAGLRDQAFANCLGDLAAGSIVLDFGCGTGSSTRSLVAMGYRAIGVDLAQDLLRHASRRLNPERAIFIAYDGVNLPLKPASIEATTIYGVLCYVREDSHACALLAAIRATMKPGARLIMIEQARRRRRTVEDGLKVQRTEKEWRCLLMDAGFRNVSSSILRHGRFPTTPLVRIGLLPATTWRFLARLEAASARISGIFPWDYADLLLQAKA